MGRLMRQEQNLEGGGRRDKKIQAKSLVKKVEVVKNTLGLK